MTVVYIHGIGNKPAPATLKRQWDQALFGVDMGARTRLAYWADIRYPQPLPGDGEGTLAIAPDAYHPSASSTRTEDVVETSKTLAPYGRAAEAYAARVASRMMTRTATDGAARTAGRIGARRVGARGVQEKILPGFLRRPVVAWLTKTFIRDTAAYFYDAAQREEMRQRLRDILTTVTGRFVVVAHSQGSIIAYDVLREFDAGAAAPLAVPRLVTIGSPLGLDEVQDHLAKPLRGPRVVEAWHNFADLLDPVALDKTLADEFTAAEIEDTIVVNRDSLHLSGFNPHSGTGYLATNPVRQAVQDTVGGNFSSPVAPFVIARDVATAMADPLTRHPVLIELKETEDRVTLAAQADQLERELHTLESTFKAGLADPVQRTQDYFKIDRLRRYVGATLTAGEIDYLVAQHKDLQIVSVWKDAVKRALLDKSTAVVQARTAHLGYGALGQDVTWAVLDTGVNTAHPHFQTYENVVKRWDCTRVGPPVERSAQDWAGRNGDPDGHGTHVSGIIAGVGRAGRRGSVGNEKYGGMAPRAKLHVYRVLDESGSGSDSWIIKALDHISQVNESGSELVIHGLNLSLGGPFDEAVFGCGFSPICRELKRLWRQGVVVCIAAGNEGRLVIDTADGEQKLNLDLSIGDPANLEDAIAVGSVHREYPHLYGISYFSSRGPTADGRAKPDVVAPGERIFSCNAQFTTPRNEYVAMSGTSMACPHVSGIVAAFLSVRREFIGSPDLVKEILVGRCTDLKRDRYHQGAGVPNLVRMLMET